MRVFSPSATDDWVRCPVFAQLRKQKEPLVDQWEPNLLMGKALNESMSYYWNWYRRAHTAPVTIGEGDSGAAAEAALKAGVRILYAGYVENDKWPVAGLEKMLTRCLEACLNEDTTSAGVIISVDQPLGVGRPDLIQVNRDNRLVITDLKFTLRLNPDYQLKRLTEYETDNQWFHYDWEAQQHFGYPPEWNRVLLVVGSPKPRVVLHPWRVDEEKVKFWLSGAEQNWRDMELEKMGVRPVAPKTQSCMGKFGRCPFYGWCWDRDAMGQFYKDVEPRDGEEGS